MVDLETALNVAADEAAAWAANLDGIYGDKAMIRAEDEGVEGIVYARWERNRRLHRLDIITGTLTSKPVSMA